jgi:hypothetical protein
MGSGLGRPAWGRPAGPTNLLEASLHHLYFLFLGAQQARKGKKRKGRKKKRNLA